MKRREMLVSTGAAVLGLSAFPFRCEAEGMPSPGQPGIFRAGAHAEDITPDWFPVVVNGGFQPRYAEEALDPLHARCLVLDDGAGQLAIVVVDSCVMDRALIDEAKEKACQLTGIPTARMFVSATHTHSAPAVVGALGTEPDERYRAWLPGRIAEGIQRAQRNLAPAEVGWAVESLPGLPQSRRWIARPDRIKVDPFGEPTTRATMHPGYRNPDWEEPSGPMNPDVSILAVRRPDGTPIALLGSFSIHYVGAGVLSADYFGVFARRVGELLKADQTDPPFVGILANGSSGDAYLKDYSRAEPETFDMFSIAEQVAQAALRAYEAIAWNAWLSIDARETDLVLNTREPRVEWGKQVMAQVEAEQRSPRNMTEAYAREQLLLAQMPATRNLKLQVLRIGELGMVGIPCEVFAITGMRIASASPLAHTFTVMLANGWDGGYLPPPEQMVLGGYTTWLARSSCLEMEAEPKIIARVKDLLADVAGDIRVAPQTPPVPRYAAAVMASQPAVYWRLNDLNGPQAVNMVDGKGLGTFETQVAYYMPGPQSPDFPGFEADNRAPHFIGQRLAADVPDLGACYTVEMWFYNCMPTDARPVAGYLFSRGQGGDCLAIGGTDCDPGRLVFHVGADLGGARAGMTDIPLRNWIPRESWHHVALVRDGEKVAVYLDGRTAPELTAAAPAVSSDAIWIAGRGDGEYGFEGRMAEVAVYRRALAPDELVKHYQAAF